MFENVKPAVKSFDQIKWKDWIVRFSTYFKNTLFVSYHVCEREGAVQQGALGCSS